MLPLLRPMTGTDPAYHPLPLVRPALTLLSLSVFTKMTFGALCGFEFVAIFAGECRNPARTLARSILFAAPIIALLYIFGTGAILTFVPSSEVNLIGPIPQALSVGLRSFGLAKILAPVTILLLLVNVLSTANLTFSASSPAAHGCWLGQPAARMVHSASSELQDADQFDTFYCWRHACRVRGSSHRGERRGGLLAGSDMGLHTLRACLSSYVCDPAGRQS